MSEDTAGALGGSRLDEAEIAERKRLHQTAWKNLLLEQKLERMRELFRNRVWKQKDEWNRKLNLELEWELLKVRPVVGEDEKDEEVDTKMPWEEDAEVDTMMPWEDAEVETRIPWKDEVVEA